MTPDSVHALLVSELSRAWEIGNPVAGSTDAVRQRIATVIQSRWHSLSRRDISKDDHSAITGDFLHALIETLEPDPHLVGPLKLDYKSLAAQLATAILNQADEVLHAPPIPDNHAAPRTRR